MATDIEVTCPYCGEIIHGSAYNIDSGLRKHIDNYCDAVTVQEED